MLWFVDGFGGESHRRRLSLSWFPVKLSEPAEWQSGFKKTTNGLPGLICLEPCCQHLANRHGHPAHRNEHLARHRGHLVPAPRHPLLYRRHLSPSHRRCASSSTAPRLPPVPLLLSICPTSPGCPRCLCFPST